MVVVGEVYVYGILGRGVGGSAGLGVQWTRMEWLFFRGGELLSFFLVFCW